MAVETLQRVEPRVSLINDPKFRGNLYQILVAVALVAFFVFIFYNATQNLIAQKKTTGFSFLFLNSSFDIQFTLFPYTRASLYWQVFLVGLTNTLLVAVIGIVFATLLGFTVGIARLSSNWLVARIATVYVETIRNIPLLLQLFFWYFAVLKAMPAVKQSFIWFDSLVLNQRGLFLPRPLFESQHLAVFIAGVIGLIISLVLRNWTITVRESTGRVPAIINTAGTVTNVILSAVVTWILLILAQALVLPEIAALSPVWVSTIGYLYILIAVLVGISWATPMAGVGTSIKAFLVISIAATLGIKLLYAALPLSALPFSPDIVPRVLGAALAIYMAWQIYVTSLGRPRPEVSGFPVSLGLAITLGLPTIVWFATGATIAFELPVLKGFNFQGGVDLPPELVALAFGLVIYTATFIAEIVRAGIQSVSHGQSEAAMSLGLRDGDRLRLVVLPQALRVIIPPLTSQYLNLTKNSSLGAFIGFPELVSVWAGTSLNQTGRAIEIITTTMLVYLTFSLTTSAIMNWYNARVALKER